MTVGIVAAAALAVPASAGELEPKVIQPSPKYGGTKTTFTAKYDNDLASDNAGDQFHLIGPRGTRCHGLVGYSPTGHEGGIQTIRMGPRAKASGYREYAVRPENPDPEARQEYFDRWCKGVYRGRVQYENADGEVEYVKVRFRFRVR